MIQLAFELERRLDKTWDDLQEEIIRRRPGISQIDCDDLCVTKIEVMVRNFIPYQQKEI